jgi:hypothetical protein
VKFLKRGVIGPFCPPNEENKGVIYKGRIINGMLPMPFKQKRSCQYLNWPIPGDLRNQFSGDGSFTDLLYKAGQMIGNKKNCRAFSHPAISKSLVLSCFN